MTTLLGIDTGGTFTDFVCLTNQGEWRVHKVLSTPKAPEQAILKGIRDLNLMDDVEAGRVIVIHGTTVATNATLEGNGVRTVYIANKGLKDVLLIGRQTRRELYSLNPTSNRLPVDPELMLEVSARLDAKGEVVNGFGDNELQMLKHKVKSLAPESIAINLLFSFLNPAHETEIESLFKDDYFVSRSSTILPEVREYERGVTTWINSWIGPLIKQYFTSLRQSLEPSPISIMQSSGLTISAEHAAIRAVNLLLSGPAGGLSAALYIGKRTDQNKIMTFDMGGTSTDVALIDEHFSLTNSGTIAGLPIGVPMADIYTIGAGGGSIAYIDDGGLLRVGPKSAGASPGPACYQQGGAEPTVTDANLVLGRLNTNRTLADGLTLSLAAAERALEPLATQTGQSIKEVAAGIIQIANEHMSQALRVISVQKGHDPREFTLMCFGGAGGLHLCELAESLEMKTALVPIHGGVLSALGMLTTKPGRELTQTLQVQVEETTREQLTLAINSLAEKGVTELLEEGVKEVTRRDSLDIRYKGQTFTLNVSFDGDLNQACDDFHAAHQQQLGHQLDKPLEILNCRVHVEANQALPELPNLGPGQNPSEPHEGTINREDLPPGAVLSGPLIINEDHATTFIKAGWQAELDLMGNLLLRRQGPR